MQRVPSARRGRRSWESVVARDRESSDPSGAAALTAAIGCVYVLQRFEPSPIWARLSALPSAFWDQHEVWRIGTYMWLHSADSLSHIAVNSWALWVFGSELACTWGTWRFVRFYVACGLGGGAAIVTWPILLELCGMPSLSYETPVVGASAAVVGILVANATAFSMHDARPSAGVNRIHPTIAMLALVGAQLVIGSQSVSLVAHLGGAIAALLVLRLRGEIRFHPRRLAERWDRWRNRRAAHRRSPK